MSALYALSIKQPWAALLALGRKTVEVRSWRTHIRGKILIHAARVADPRPEAWKWVTDEVLPLTRLAGGVIGEAELIDCIAYPESTRFESDALRHLNEPTWFQPRGLFGFVFDRACVRSFHPYPGNVRFFTVKNWE